MRPFEKIIAIIYIIVQFYMYNLGVICNITNNCYHKVSVSKRIADKKQLKTVTALAYCYRNIYLLHNDGYFNVDNSVFTWWILRVCVYIGFGTAISDFIDN